MEVGLGRQGGRKHAARTLAGSRARVSRPTHRRLRVEPLEDRRLLALLALEVNLYEDANGVPGAPITDDTVEVGEPFFVEISAQDISPYQGGVGGLSLDIQFDPAVLRCVDEPFDPRAPDSLLVTPNFPVFRSGTLDAEAGLINELGGSRLRSSGQGQAIGVGRPGQFALLKFTALAPVEESPLAVSIGQGGIGMLYRGRRRASDVIIDSQRITVVAGAEPPQVEVTASSGPDLTTIQFTTEVPGTDQDALPNPLVRPAYPDTKQYVDVTNTGPSPLTIYEIEVNAPDVSLDPAVTTGPADDLVIPPGERQRLHLSYAPTLPNADDASTQSFHVADGLVICTNAENAPELAVTLAGDSTFDADVSLDGTVNLTDLILFDENYGRAAGDADYDPTADPNGDGQVDMADFAPFSLSYGLSRSGPWPALLPGEAERGSEEPTPLEPGAADAVFGSLAADDPRAVSPAEGSDEELIAAAAAAWLDADDDGDDRRQDPSPTAVDPTALLYSEG
jgi:hypothetical protein